MLEWLMRAYCKFVGYTYAGSNPARPKKKVNYKLYMNEYIIQIKIKKKLINVRLLIISNVFLL